MYILDEVLDWLAENSSFFGRERVQVNFWEGGDLGGAFGLLALTVDVQLIVLGAAWVG